MSENHSNGWRDFIVQAREFVSSDRFKSNLKTHWKIGRRVADARASVLREDDNWVDSVKKMDLPGNSSFS